MNPNDPQQPLPPNPNQTPTPGQQPTPLPAPPQNLVVPGGTPTTTGSSEPYFKPTVIAPDINQDNYEFITKPAHPPKKPGVLTGGSTLRRSLIALSGLALLIIVAAVLFSIVTGGGPDTTAQLTTVAQEQTELIRIGTAGTTNASSSATQGLASAVQLSMLSARSQISSYMATNKEKLDPKLLGLKRSAEVDAQLTAAQANSTYDATFGGIITQDLNSYGAALKAAYAANPGPKGRDLLKKQYADAVLLLQQTKAATDASAAGN